MRDSQMKKIIAAAVATAFIAPAFAADVTVGGNMDFVFNDTDSGTSGATNDVELKVSAAEELGNGMSVSAYINKDTDVAATLSGAFGSAMFTNDDTGIGTLEDQADVGVENGGRAGVATGITSPTAVIINPNLGIEGVTPMIGYSAGTTAGDTSVDFGVKVDFAGLSARFATADRSNDNDSVEVVSVSYSVGPLKVAYDSVSNQGGVAEAEVKGFGVTYNLGNGITLYGESSKANYDWNLSTVTYAVLSGQTDNELESQTVGASYAMGGLTFFAEADSIGTKEGSDTDETTFGVRYAF